MTKSPERPAMRGTLALAIERYATRVRELAAEGVTGESANAVVLREARAAGGVLREGETINLSMWSERLAMPRDVLEALALAIRATEEGEPEPATPIAIASAPEASFPAMTPAPVATRNPPVDDVATWQDATNRKRS